MADFLKYYPTLKKLEGFDMYGGKVYHIKGDNDGGGTRKGVTLTTYKSIKGANKTAVDLDKEPESFFQDLYKQRYWDACKADQIKNQSVAEIFVDFGVNSGTKTAIKKIQGILGLVVDGIVGPKTLGAINSMDSKVLFKKIYDVRLAYYNAIVKNNPTQIKFLKGWTNRINSFKFSY